MKTENGNFLQTIFSCINSSSRHNSFFFTSSININQICHVVPKMLNI